MTYNVSSGTLNTTIPYYYTIPWLIGRFTVKILAPDDCLLSGIVTQSLIVPVCIKYLLTLVNINICQHKWKHADAREKLQIGLHHGGNVLSVMCDVKRVCHYDWLIQQHCWPSLVQCSGNALDSINVVTLR